MNPRKNVVGIFASLTTIALLLAACASPTTIAPTATAGQSAPLPNTGATEIPTSPPPTSTAAIFSVVSNPTLGNILADKNGRTLYVFTKDTPDTSTCYDQCAQKWPALTVDQASSLNAGEGISVKLGTTQRTDGSLQVTVNGMPVYYWYKDTGSGDTNGQGVGNVWFVLDPSGQIVKTPLPTSTAMPAATPGATSTPAANAPVVLAAENTALGTILTDSHGMTLYAFTKDQAGTSTCYDQCAQKWPALIVDQGTALTAGDGVSAELGTTQRTDGSLQVTVNGMPVYTFFQDTKAGDTNGQGVGSVWYVLGADGNIIQK